MKKIRKTYSGVVPNGKVLNTKNNSTNDTYSCDYINKLSEIKISPNEPTMGEKVWIDFANYFSPQEIVDAYISATVGSQIEIISSDTTKTYKKVCSVESGKTYIIKWKANNPKALRERASAICDNSNNVLQVILHNNTNSCLLTFTATSSGYLYLGLDANATEITITDKIPSLKVNNNGSYETILYSNDYSTNEHVIGTWMGKPLYRKVLTATTSSTEMSGTNLFSFDDYVDLIINFRVFVVTSGNIKQFGAGNEAWVRRVDKAIAVSNDNRNYYSSPAYCIIEYTKTTD